MKPTDILKKEHKAILQMLDVIENIGSGIQKGEQIDVKHFENILDFLKTFVDKCHHVKEEKILFPAMISTGVPANSGPIAVMLIEHERGREFVQGMAKAIEEIKGGKDKEYLKFKDSSLNYSVLLRDHIYKEDNLLYPMANSRLDEKTCQKLIAGFEKVEKEIIGKGKHEQYHLLIKELTNIYLKK